MSEQLVTIEVDGRELQARPGAMLIEITDAAGITVPRFCYHKKLSVAANCRMCLVEVEKAPKPLPACATPVAAGMKVYTKSPRALAAQKGTMEFLLINHPLDCPICDQGGECELQDVSLGFGSSESRYGDTKRVVADKDIGPLIATEMTRCIHCTRCVRFGEEIAGLRELGATGRGEFVRIGTYIEKSVDSELSGNVIDLCPVGALTAKPSRFKYRAWELLQHAAVSAHDCVGSNSFLHTYNGKVMRVVPRENEALNEVWLSDRDRFSYEGIYAADRVAQPLLKNDDGSWREASWEEALQVAADHLRQTAPAELTALVSPAASLEEQYLLQKLLRALGSNNIDHRTLQTDFSDQAAAPVMPWLGVNFSELEDLQAALLIASNIRKEQPLAALRLRKAAAQGAKISFINSRRYSLNFDAEQVAVHPAQLLTELAALLAAVYAESKQAVPAHFQDLLSDVVISDACQQLAKQLLSSERKLVVLGSQAVSHPQFAQIRALAAAIAAACGCQFGYLPEAANTAGAWLAGCVPHRGPAGEVLAQAGRHAGDMLSKPGKTCVLYGVEPEFDCYDSQLAQQSLQQTAHVIAITAYASEALKSYAKVILPIGGFAEISGTWVNAEGRWQTTRAAAKLLGEARPGWKVLRVLGNLLECSGFDYTDVTQVCDDIKASCRDLELNNRYSAQPQFTKLKSTKGFYRYGEVAAYSSDAVLRRAPSLQQTKDAREAEAVHLHSQDVSKLKLNGDARVTVTQGDCAAVLPVYVNDDVLPGTAWIPAATSASKQLGALHGAIELKKV